MELKVVCGCGQKYKFDVEPVNGRMPMSVACPVCGVDGTESANSILSQNFPAPPPPIPVARVVPVAAAAPAPVTAAAPVGGGLRINRLAPAPVTAGPPPLPAAPRPVAPPPRPLVSPSAAPKKAGEFNLGLGILGALLGAGLGAGLMYGFFLLADFRFPLMGTCIGALTGLGARILYRGTDMTMGMISGAIALISTAGTLYFMFGDLAGMFIISMVVSVILAYRIAG